MEMGCGEGNISLFYQETAIGHEVMASICARGCSDQILGRISSQKE